MLVCLLENDYNCAIMLLFELSILNSRHDSISQHFTSVVLVVLYFFPPRFRNSARRYRFSFASGYLFSDGSAFGFFCKTKHKSVYTCNVWWLR
ncbi:hypothetical protein OESDEN_06109 [Oesophagostomum dentatum]|uniref:Uncharacterized protein n=1 Tax=Oesophagostomum dentatum TaxID=61180 RepID=A0A0B1TCW1_OESDE|nr:hypothetical protein OESDEN_06109 [Oesophagostomum dentatum]